MYKGKFERTSKNEKRRFLDITPTSVFQRHMVGVGGAPWDTF